MSTSRNGRGGIPIPAPLAAVIFGCIALLLLGTAIREVTEQWDDRTHGTSVSGVVREAEYVRGLGADITIALDAAPAGRGSAPTVSILDPNAAPSGLRPGQRVAVLYDAAHPTQAVFPSQVSWGRPALLGSIGLVALALCVARSIASLRAYRRNAEGRDRSASPKAGPPFEGWGTSRQDAAAGVYIDRSNEPLFPDKKMRSRRID